MAKTAGRPPNPKCAECRHPASFHPAQNEGRPCKAFGCPCDSFKKGEA